VLTCFVFAYSIYRPLPAAIFGAVRLLGLVFYVQGYATGDPTKRLRGGFGAFLQIAEIC
jgi:hypothetical protein